jgi:flagellar biosynthesis chaperone FliJ
MNNLQCTNYFRKCLVNQNIDDCKEFLKSDKYWDIMTKEVSKLDPVIALETIKAFEFDLETNNNVVQPETIASWSSKLENKLGGENSKKDAELIRSNDKIMKYLIAIREVVVSEPALLNMRKRDRSNVSNSPIPAKRFTSKYTYRFVSELKKNVKQQWTNQAINWNMLNNDQKGGNDSIIESIEKENLQVPFLWQSLGSLIKNINIKKDENKADLKEIQNNLMKLKDAETKLYKTFWYKKKYVDLINLGYNDGKNSVSMDDIKQFVDKFNNTRNRYLVKVSQRQNKLLTMIEMLAQRIEKL